MNPERKKFVKLNMWLEISLWCKMLRKQPTIVDNGQKTPFRSESYKERFQFWM